MSAIGGLADALDVRAPLIVLDHDAPIPDGTPVGAVIVRRPEP